MKKQYPFYSGSYFYNQKKEIVAITLKDVIIHYILNIFNKSHLYKNKKNNNHVSLALSFKYFFLKKKLILANDIVVIPLGHATVLVMYQNKAILFDPLFFFRFSFFKTICRKY